MKSLVDEGALHYVADAPAFPFPIWSVWRDDLDENIARLAERELKATIKIAETDQEDVLDALEELSEDGVVETLGDFLDSEEDSE